MNIKKVMIKNADGVEIPAARFGAKLTKVTSLNPLFLNNEKKTPFRLVNIEFKDNNNTVQTGSAIMFEKNFAHGVKENEEYMCTATVADDKKTLYVQMSHLPVTGDRVTVDMLGVFDFEAVTEAIKEAARVTTATA
jgi:hypothetical protein